MSSKIKMACLNCDRRLIIMTLAILLRFDLSDADESLDPRQLGLIMVAATVALPLLAIVWEARAYMFSKLKPKTQVGPGAAAAIPESTAAIESTDNPVGVALEAPFEPPTFTEPAQPPPSSSLDPDPVESNVAAPATSVPSQSGDTDFIRSSIDDDLSQQQYFSPHLH